MWGGWWSPSAHFTAANSSASGNPAVPYLCTMRGAISCRDNGDSVMLPRWRPSISPVLDLKGMRGTASFGEESTWLCSLPQRCKHPFLVGSVYGGEKKKCTLRELNLCGARLGPLTFRKLSPKLTTSYGL